jgi:hypothetical protein
MKNCTIKYMKQNVIFLLCFISVILIVLASGCITPPKENATILKKGTSSSGGNPLNPATTETPNYVTEVTPYTSLMPTTQPHTMLTAAPVPQDIYCRIYSTKNTYNYNKTAVAFDLKYPPMYINYTVKPSNVTYKDVIDRKITGQGEEEITVDKYSPLSWFEVTVRSKTTPDKIYIQDGFGESKGYTLYLNRTLKIVNRDDMQVEFFGNNITATASVWVKPEGNFNDTSQFNMTTDCAYFASNPRDVYVIGTPTTTATPTYRPQPA